jgi:hypothetical protein
MNQHIPAPPLEDETPASTVQAPPGKATRAGSACAVVWC